MLKDGTLECSPIIMTFDESFEKKEGAKYVVTFSFASNPERKVTSRVGVLEGSDTYWTDVKTLTANDIPIDSLFTVELVEKVA